MGKERSLEIVERDLKRVKRAERRLRRDWNNVHRNLAKNGGLEPVLGKPPKLSPFVRMQRELGKSLKLTADEIRSLTAEKAALELQVKEAHDDYAL